MTDEVFKHERIKVFVERYSALRCREYTVVVHGRENDEEISAFTFCVSDSGKQVEIGELVEAAKFAPKDPPSAAYRED